MIDQIFLWGGIITSIVITGTYITHIVHHLTKQYTNKALADEFATYENETRAKIEKLTVEVATLTTEFESINNMLQANGLTRSGFRPTTKRPDPNML